MSILHLTDVIVRHSRGLDHGAPDGTHIPRDSKLYLEAFFGETSTTRRLPLVQESGSSWKAAEVVEMPADCSCQFSVVYEHPENGFMQLGYIELEGDRLLALSMEGTGEVAERLDDVGSGYGLEITFKCVSVLSEPTQEQITKALGRDGGDEVVDFLYQKAMHLNDNDIEKPKLLMASAHFFRIRYETVPRSLYLDNAISAAELAVTLFGDGDLGQQAALRLLGQLLQLRYSQFQTLSDIDRAILVTECSAALGEGNAEQRIGDLMTLGSFLNMRFQRSGDLFDIGKAIDSQNEAVQLTPDSHIDKPVCFNDLASSYFCRFQRSGDLLDVEKAIECQTEAVHRTPDGEPSKPSFLNNLGSLSHALFDRSGNLLDMDKAIKSRNEAVRLTPDDHAKKPFFLSNLGTLLARRFEHSGDLPDIDKAIEARTEAVRLTPDYHPEKPGYLNNLGNSLQHRFQHSGDLLGIEKAIESQNQAALLIPDGHAYKPSILSNLAVSLNNLFERSGDLLNIEKAIDWQSKAVLLTMDGDVDKPGRLRILGTLLLRHFEQSGDLSNIDQAINSFSKAVRLTPDGHADKTILLSNLGGSLVRRFERSGDLHDIGEAIEFESEAVRLTPIGHPDKSRRLDNLGTSFNRRFERSGNLLDIENAIKSQNEAVCLTANGHADKPAHFSNLANSFNRRFQRSGDLLDIEKAIEFQKEAVRLTPDGHAEKPRFLSNLGTSFCCRFERSGDLHDIEKAMESQTEAIHLTPDGHAEKPKFLNNLGNSLVHHFECLDDLIDLEKAIESYKEAVSLTPDHHTDKPNRLVNLGVALESRFVRLGDPVDIENAIESQNKAIHLTPDDHADKPSRLGNLAASLYCRFEHSGYLPDIDQAINTVNMAVRLTPDGHANKPTFLSNLGKAFSRRFRESADVLDIDSAITQYQLSASSSTGPPSVRLKSAMSWARLAASRNSSTSLEGYEVALKLIPIVAWLGQTISTRHKELVEIGGVASEAASAAIQSGQYDLALEWLEQGRSVVWGQILNLRTPFDGLRAADEALADDLVKVSKALESAGTRDASSMPGQSEQQTSLEQATQQHLLLAKEWDALVEKARSLPGFQDFLRPKRFSQLVGAARSGPVVVVNVQKSRCDALVVMAGLDEPIHVPLDGISYDQAKKLQTSLNKLLSDGGVRMRDTRGPKKVLLGGVKFSEILASLWKGVVKPVLDALAFSISDASDPPRIWWCPTGPLTFLPIHAAGIYDTQEVGFKISDYVVSSYTPTLTALLSPPPPASQDFQGLLAIGQPNTPGLTQLPNASKELAQIQRLGSKLNVHSLLGKDATIESVVGGMDQHSWVHLACHAVQDNHEPTASGFCLEDGSLTLSRIITKQFPHADFAFLSACQTATGADNLSEEAAHLAAGMLAAGYRSVIATMWSIKDNDAPIIAEEVYRHFVLDSKPDSARAAHSLHHAVQHLRKQLGSSDNTSFLSWVPFIHVGM